MSFTCHETESYNFRNHVTEDEEGCEFFDNPFESNETCGNCRQCAEDE